VLIGQGKTVRELCQTLEVSEQTYYRWRNEYGGLDATQARELKELEKENARLTSSRPSTCGLGRCVLREEPGGRPVVGQCHSEGGAVKKIVSPERRRETVDQVRGVFAVSERRVCRALGQPRSTQRYQRQGQEDESQLTAAIVVLASRYGRYGYRRITALLRRDGWQVNHKRVERIWRQEGLKVPAKQPKRGRLVAE
jgi:transposase InsO family protein